MTGPIIMPHRPPVGTRSCRGASRLFRDSNRPEPLSGVTRTGRCSAVIGLVRIHQTHRVQRGSEEKAKDYDVDQQFHLFISFSRMARQHLACFSDAILNKNRTSLCDDAHLMRRAEAGNVMNIT